MPGDGRMGLRVQVRLGGTLPLLTGRSVEQHLDLPEGTTVGDALQAAGVKPGLAMLVSVDGHVRHSNYILSDGDHMVVVPPVSGG
jgi:sulfur carrier protein ThiS